MSNSAIDAAFLQGCEQCELRLQRCTACGSTQFYPRVICGHCGSDELEWIVANGGGRVASFTVARSVIDPKFKDLLPYVVALIDLEEGPRMMSVIVDAETSDVSVGDSVTLDFVHWGDDAQLRPVFRLA